MDQPFTIAKLAKAAGVGVETIRYYERRKLIAQPRQRVGAYRGYDRTHVARVRSSAARSRSGSRWKRSRRASRLALEDGTDRRSVRRIASVRLEEIRGKLDDLRRMARALEHLLRECETDGSARRCPIIAAIAARDASSAQRNQRFLSSQPFSRREKILFPLDPSSATAHDVPLALRERG